MAKEQTNTLMKVIIGIVIVVIVVLLFRGLGKERAPAAPGTAPGEQPAAPSEMDKSGVQPPKPATTPAEVVRTHGLELVEDVRCDLEARTVTFTFTNTLDKESLKIYTGELVQLEPASEENRVQIAVNGRWSNAKLNRILDCGGKIEFGPGESATCTYGGAVLRDPAQKGELTGMFGQNVLTASNLNSAFNAYNDLDYFVCQ